MKLKRVLFFLCGVLSLILAYMCYNMGTGENERDQAYGGDAYTGIQQAAAAGARNTRELAEITRFGFSSVLLVSGATLIVASLPGKREDETDPDKGVDVKTAE